MGMRISKREVKERLYEIQQKLEVNENELHILEGVIDNDISALSIIIMQEGYMRRIKSLIEDTLLNFLLEYSKGDYEVFKKYHKKDISELNFLNKEQKLIISLYKRLYKKSIQEYFENRGDLMIFRKTFNNFIVERIKNKEDINEISTVRNYLINNYSYYDSLFNLGLNPEIGEDGFVKLNKLVLSEDGYLK